uniref:HAP1 N-terminal domain-containing protein n=1 Tax=Trichobilharzia regenti TaxID=157069 RepID=A0AA85JYQ9_TRIRE|nr:unnamed protein product [Trichobilharzia regenti]
MHIRTLSDELAKKSDAYINQQSEVTRLLTRGLDLESRVKQLTAENEMLINRLKEAQISQTLLTSELKTSRDKYDECLTLYNEARSEIRALRKRSRRSYFRPGSLMSNTSIMNSPTSWHHTPSLSSNYLSGIAITPTQSDPDPTSCYNPSSSHQNVSDDDDGSSSSLDMLATQQHPGSDNLETTLAADLAHTKMKEYAADNVKHLFRAMEQVRSTRTPSSQPTSSIDNNNHNIMLPESGQEDTVSSSGFVSGSEPSENPLKHRSGGSEQVSDSGSPYAGRLLANQNISPIHLQDVERRPGSGGYQQQQHHHYYQTRSNHEHLLESEKRHSWLGCCDISSNVSEKGYLSGHDYNIKYKNSFDDSLLSCDPDVVGTNQLYYKLPQRLKLIKPLDGSNVLQHWQNLATPSFTRALFDAPLPGVQSRAGVPNTASNSASNTKITDDNIDDKRRTMSFQPLPLNSISSKYDDGLTTYSTFNSPQTQTNVKFPCDSLERRHKISQFGSNSSTCLLNNRIRARSLDHLIMGSPSGTTTGGGGGSSYCKDKINESVQFSRAFNHIRLDDSSMTMSPTAPFRTPFSLTSLVSAILPFSVSPQSDDKSSSVSKPSVTSSSNITESMRLRPKCPLATTTTGLQGLLDMHKEEDSDTSKTLLHRTSSSTTSKSIPANQTTSSSSSSIPICSNTPNPQPPTLICPNIVNRPTQYTRSSRGTNLTEITEESSSPPKSQESLSQQQQQQETQQIHETTLGSQE